MPVIKDLLVEHPTTWACPEVHASVSACHTLSTCSMMVGIRIPSLLGAWRWFPS